MFNKHTLPIAGLMSGVALLLIGNGLLGTLLAIKGNEAGFSDTLLGLLGSGYFAGYLLGSVFARPLIQRVGHIRAFAFFAAGLAGIALLHGLFVSATTWVVLRVLAGASVVSLYTLIESWLNDQTPQAQRGRIFAMYMVVNQTSLAMAQQMLNFDLGSSMSAFMMSAFFVCFAVMPVTATPLPQPTPHRTSSFSPWPILRRAPLAGISAILTGMAIGAFWSMGPVYASRTGYGNDWIALFMSAGILGGALLQWPLGVLSDRGDRRTALAVAASFAALCAVPLLWGHLGETAAIAAITLFGGFAFAIYPIVVAHLVDHLSGEEIVSGSNVVLLLYGIGAAIGPLLVGLLMSSIGSSALAALFIATHVVLALTAWISKLRKRDDVVEHSHCVSMMRTSPEALELMPAANSPHTNDGESPAAPKAQTD